ncbi:MAG: MBL fold metallo-hydrolase [Clostridia bacterium]|nr:MBL fold metallo-hydrolase [Clostridia bacterium]
MKIRSLTVGSIGENVYLLDDGDGVILIDPGADFAAISAALAEKQCKHVLLTHAHYDHIGAVAQFQKQGAKVYLHRDDVKLLNGAGHLAALFGETLQSFVPDVLLNGGETLQLGTFSFRVLSTPGHTDGSVCYITDNVIFSGDTLFRLSVGRTDFPSGDAAKLRDSLKNRLFALEEDYTVYPGHDSPTTLSFERENNPYV